MLEIWGNCMPADGKLKLVYMSPADLVENPQNWRRHPTEQIAALTDVISEVGWAGACLFNERTGRLIDGHARRKVALEQGAASVPVLVGDWSEADEAKILATLDPLAAMAQTDATALDALLRDVQTGSDAITGMLKNLSESAADSWGALTPEPGQGGDEFDATPEDDGPTRAKTGDLWVIGGKHRLLVGDCTDKGNVARLLNGATPHLMVTDPPYGVEYDPEWRNEALGEANRAVGLVANDHKADWRETWAMFPAPVAYVWHAGRRASEVQQSLEAGGFKIISQIVWAKQHFALSRGDYHWQHEPCWYAVRDGHGHNWQGSRNQSTLWEINNGLSQGGGDAEMKTGHGTQKPIECMSRPIANNTAPGQLVVDPFLGSGTTLIAAHRLGRTCYGCEIEPKYADVILKRAEAEGLKVEKDGGK